MWERPKQSATGLIAERDCRTRVTIMFHDVNSSLLGQKTTHTDAEGNVSVTVRYPYNDPEGAAQYPVPTLSNKQYGFVASGSTRFDEAGRAYETQRDVFFAGGGAIPSGRTVTYGPESAPKPQPRPSPKPDPAPDPKRRPTIPPDKCECTGRWVPRRTKHLRHDSWATAISGRDQDYEVTTPPPGSITKAFDGLEGFGTLFEIKTGYKDYMTIRAAKFWPLRTVIERLKRSGEAWARTGLSHRAGDSRYMWIQVSVICGLQRWRQEL